MSQLSQLLPQGKVSVSAGEPRRDPSSTEGRVAGT